GKAGRLSGRVHIDIEDSERRELLGHRRNLGSTFLRREPGQCGQAAAQGSDTYFTFLGFGSVLADSYNADLLALNADPPAAPGYPLELKALTARQALPRPRDA